MKLRTKLTVKMWLLRSACVMSIASACIWAIPIFHGDYYAGLTGIALSYILAIFAAGFSWATEWDIKHIDLLIDEEVEKQIKSYDEIHSLGNELIEAHECMHKELDDDLAKHTAIFKRHQKCKCKDRAHLEHLIDKGTMPPALVRRHPHPIGWRYAETSTEDPPFASTDGEEIKVNPRKLQDHLEG